MLIYTADQLALLQTRDVLAKLAIDIDRTPALRYCSGSTGITIGGDYFAPRLMKFDTFEVADPSQAKTKIRLGDSAGDLRAANYTDRFSDDPITVYLYLRAKPEDEWTQILSVEWICENSEIESDGTFTLNLHGASGLRRKAGELLGSRASFEYAPSPNAKITVGVGKIVFYDAP